MAALAVALVGLGVLVPALDVPEEPEPELETGEAEDVGAGLEPDESEEALAELVAALAEDGVDTLPVDVGAGCVWISRTVTGRSRSAASAAI